MRKSYKFYAVAALHRKRYEVTVWDRDTKRYVNVKTFIPTNTSKKRRMK